MGLNNLSASYVGFLANPPGQNPVGFDVADLRLDRRRPLEMVGSLFLKSDDTRPSPLLRGHLF
jgi:hypothetical protein